LKTIWQRYRAELFLGLALLLPLLAPGRTWLGSLLSGGLLALPRAAASSGDADENQWRDAYYRSLLTINDLEVRLLAVATSERLVARDPSFWGRRPVRIEAEVIGRDASPWRGSVTISAGSRDGVKPGQAVVVGEALVGLVFEAGMLTARVRLLGDAGQRIWAEILTSDGPREGIVVGTGDRDLTMKHVAAGVGRKGDPVFTGGGAVGVPRGLLMGPVIRIEDVNRDGCAEVEVRPAVDVKDLRIVNVLALPE